MENFVRIDNNKIMGNVMLINLPYDPPIGWSYLHGQHMGLAYIASALRSRSCEVKIFDCILRGISLDQLVDMLIKESATKGIDCIGLTLTQGSYRECVDFLKKLDEKGLKTLIVVGGHFVSQNAMEVMEHCDLIDVAVIGEGEKILCDIMEHHLQAKSFEKVSNIIWRNDQQQIIQNDLAPLVDDLDDYPYPAPDDRDYIFDFGNNDISLISSRGCYGRCSFCSNYYPLFKGKRWRCRSVESVIEEIKDLVKEKENICVRFQNENFFGPGKLGSTYVEELCDEIIKNDISITFRIFARVNDIKPEIIKKLKIAGCISLYVGFESINESSLKLYNKNISVEEIRNAIKILEECEMEFEVGFIFFEPYQNLEEFKNNIDFYKMIMKNRWNITANMNDYVVPLKGTSLYQKLKDDGMLINDCITGGYELNFNFTDPHVQEISNMYQSIIKNGLQPFLLEHKVDYELASSVITIKLDVLDYLINNVHQLDETVYYHCLNNIVGTGVDQMKEYLKKKFNEIIQKLRQRKVTS